MGGCRCTYRNCTSKSDGKTHMFHYPVYEKLRCHQWLVNAQRLEFLDLKVSQLKNRVVCHHHFKEDNFMNYMKDKLKFDAVPTEDGPYCDSTNWVNSSKHHIIDPIIILEDIENDCDPFSKKANSSMKYRDFLTNSDFDEQLVYDDKISLPNNNPNSAPKQGYQSDDKITFKYEPLYSQNVNHNLSLHNMNQQNITKSQSLIQPNLIVSPYDNVYNTHYKNQILPQKQYENKYQKALPKKSDEINNYIPSSVLKKEPPKIKIISEKKINVPIAIRGQFRKVSPNTMITPLRNDNTGTNIKPIEVTDTKVVSPCLLPNIVEYDNSYTVNVEYEPLQSQTINATNNVSPIQEQNETNKEILINNKIRTKQKDCGPSNAKILVSKNKVTPERLAAINTKREFNMKLKNIIESCFDTKESTQKTKNENIIQAKKSITPLPLENKNELVKSQLTGDPHTPNIQQYTIAFLESSMSKMENNLLNKIDQNTKRILELKNSITTTCSRKRDFGVQTNESLESYKQFLYQEISTFLCPSSKSIIYEELFINKYAICESNTKPRSKRKRQ